MLLRAHKILGYGMVKEIGKFTHIGTAEGINRAAEN